MARNRPRKSFITFQVETEVVSKLDHLAEEQGCTRSGYIRWLMLRTLARMEQEAATSPSVEAPRLESSATA